MNTKLTREIIGQQLTQCKFHSGERSAIIGGFSHDRHVLVDADAHRKSATQSAQNRYQLFLKTFMKYIILVFFITFSIFAKGQLDSNFYKNYFSFNLTQKYVSELEFSFEKKFNTIHGLKIDLGYRIRFIKYSAGFLPESDSIDLYSHKGYNINLGYNYYISQSISGNHQNFLSANILFKHTTCNPVTKVSGQDGEYGYAFYSTYQDKYGIKFSYGHKIILLNKKENYSTFFELIGGIGINKEKVNSIFYGYWGGHKASPNFTLNEIKQIYPTPIRNITYWKTRFTFHIGIKFGIAWRNKNE